MTSIDARELERLQAIARAVKERIDRHDAMCRKAGGVACRDDYCRTFKPLMGMRVPA